MEALNVFLGIFALILILQSECLVFDDFCFFAKSAFNCCFGGIFDHSTQSHTATYNFKALSFTLTWIILCKTLKYYRPVDACSLSNPRFFRSLLLSKNDRS